MKDSNSKFNSLSEIFGAVSIRKVNGRILLSPVKKRSNPKPTDSQKAVMNRFTKASWYAKRQLEDPVTAAMYRDGINAKMKSAYSVALNDALKAPTVEEIGTEEYHGRIGDIITIRAHDDFKVVRVRVSIRNKNGQLLEQGDAVIDEVGYKWEYRTTVANPEPGGTKIIATAFDYPENKGTLEKVLEQPVSPVVSMKDKRKPRKLHLHKVRPGSTRKPSKPKSHESAVAETAMADETKNSKLRNHGQL